jgi:hypothetical protein
LELCDLSYSLPVQEDKVIGQDRGILCPICELKLGSGAGGFHCSGKGVFFLHCDEKLLA